MSYIEKSLVSGEKIEHVFKPHWLIFVPCLIDFAMAGGMVVAGHLVPNIGMEAPRVILFFLFSLHGIWLFIKALVAKMTTEIGLTNKRLIAKQGLIRRTAGEMPYDAIESISIDQSVFGRILGHGSILVTGRGGSALPLNLIDDPMLVKKLTYEAMETAKKAA